MNPADPDFGEHAKPRLALVPPSAPAEPEPAREEPDREEPDREEPAGEEPVSELWASHGRALLRFACKLTLGDQYRAEDSVQETLLRAWRALERFEPRAQFQTWLYRIATNACLDELERRPRRPEPIDPFPDRPSDATAT